MIDAGVPGGLDDVEVRGRGAGAGNGDEQETIQSIQRGPQRDRGGVVRPAHKHTTLGKIGRLGGVSYDGNDLPGGDAARQ